MKSPHKSISRKFMSILKSVHASQLVANVLLSEVVIKFFQYLWQQKNIKKYPAIIINSNGSLTASLRCNYQRCCSGNAHDSPNSFRIGRLRLVWQQMAKQQEGKTKKKNFNLTKYLLAKIVSALHICCHQQTASISSIAATPI